MASSQRLPPVAPQTGEEPGIPPLRSIIADGNAQRLLLPDQYEQPLAPRDPRVRITVISSVDAPPVPRYTSASGTPSPVMSAVRLMQLNSRVVQSLEIQDHS